ncbi:MAG: hypothetical protein NUV77_04615 [Thermoguttaceae bacterium]|jgi:hypothetical protein|nr:hypothetical protein [Thermoguttaceae bacterium]
MSEAAVDLFVEDRAHEEFLKALVRRLSDEAERKIAIRVRSARGGHGRVLNEFDLYQEAVLRGLSSIPDLLVVAVDTNCTRHPEALAELETHLRPEFRGRTAFACPDPHIERWYMADPESFTTIVGVEPPLERRKCERDRYKRQLVEAIRKAGQIPTLGGIEFAKDLVAAMDLYRAGRREPSLGLFVQGARALLRSLEKR